mgnify:CR=1 FL=1
MVRKNRRTKSRKRMIGGGGRVVIPVFILGIAALALWLNSRETDAGGPNNSFLAGVTAADVYAAADDFADMDPWLTEYGFSVEVNRPLFTLRRNDADRVREPSANSGVVPQAKRDLWNRMRVANVRFREGFRPGPDEIKAMDMAWVGVTASFLKLVRERNTGYTDEALAKYARTPAARKIALKISDGWLQRTDIFSPDLGITYDALADTRQRRQGAEPPGAEEAAFAGDAGM